MSARAQSVARTSAAAFALMLSAQVAGAVGVASPAAARPSPAPARTAAVAALTSALVASSGGAAAAELRTSWSPSGALTYLGAPGGTAFAAPERHPGQPEVAARAFVLAHRDLFGLGGAGADLRAGRVKDRGARRFTRLDQTHFDAKVFGAEAVVQQDPQDDVQAVIATLAVEDGDLPTDAAAARPGLDATAAATRARTRAAERGASPSVSIGAPELVWFVPRLIGDPGPTRLAWEVEVHDPDSPALHARWFLDAANGELVRELSLAEDARVRRIYDMASDTSQHTPPVARGEGGPATGIAQVDLAYQYLGLTYDFYAAQNGRDGMNGAGLSMDAWVRVCTRVPNYQCPWQNASWNGSLLQFGDGWVADDIVAHEFTHGVTQYESNLVYANESGAINEALSDIFGEFVDLDDGVGNDAAGVRWQVGEDGIAGTLRSMSNPPQFGDPDRRNSFFYYTGTDDDGGVHTNSGVANKLCFLLTDGQAFNGQVVSGMGWAAVEQLFYEAQTNLLTSTAGWLALGTALEQSAINLGWSTADQNNLYHAILAVEIAGNADIVWVDLTSGCAPTGHSVCGAITGPYHTIGQAMTLTRVGSTVIVRPGTYHATALSKAMTITAESGGVTVVP